MSEPISVTDDGPVRVLRFARPEKKNAITQAMYATLAEGITSAANVEAIRAIAILGQPGIFTAGNDLNDFIAFALGDLGEKPVNRFLLALARNEKPLVAGVDGQAVGVGTTLLFHCDQVIASPASRFLTPFVDLGLVPEAGSSLLAPRLMGHHRAFALLAMGEPFDAQAAREAGFVNRIVPSAEVDAATLEIARKMASKPAGGLLAARRLLKGDPAEVVARIEQETKLFGERLKSPEARAAFQAFFTRR